MWHAPALNIENTACTQRRHPQRCSPPPLLRTLHNLCGSSSSSSGQGALSRRHKHACRWIYYACVLNHIEWMCFERGPHSKVPVYFVECASRSRISFVVPLSAIYYPAALEGRSIQRTYLRSHRPTIASTHTLDPDCWPSAPQQDRELKLELLRFALGSGLKR